MTGFPNLSRLTPSSRPKSAAKTDEAASAAGVFAGVPADLGSIPVFTGKLGDHRSRPDVNLSSDCGHAPEMEHVDQRVGFLITCEMARQEPRPTDHPRQIKALGHRLSLSRPTSRASASWTLLASNCWVRSRTRRFSIALAGEMRWATRPALFKSGKFRRSPP